MPPRGTVGNHVLADGGLGVAGPVGGADTELVLAGVDGDGAGPLDPRVVAGYASEAGRLPRTAVDLELHPGDAGVLMGIFFKHGWFNFHGVLYVLSGALLLSGWYVPVGLTILGPFLVNILLFHLTIMPGIAPGLVATVLELFLIWAYLPAFRGSFTAKMEPQRPA